LTGGADLPKVGVECGFGGWAGEAKTALVVVDSARGFPGGRFDQVGFGPMIRLNGHLAV
jgi:hypothetical protein